MDNDTRLKAMFAALKQEDQHRAPDIDTILQRATAADRPTKRRWPIYGIAAMLALLAIGLGWFYLYPYGNSHPAFTPVRMAQWHSPTDALLAFPGRPLGGSIDTGDESLEPILNVPAIGPTVPKTYFLDMPIPGSSKSVL